MEYWSKIDSPSKFYFIITWQVWVEGKCYSSTTISTFYFSSFVRNVRVCSGKCIFPVSFPLRSMLLLFYYFTVYSFMIIMVWRTQFNVLTISSNIVNIYVSANKELRFQINKQVITVKQMNLDSHKHIMQKWWYQNQASGKSKLIFKIWNITNLPGLI
jgi:hypothetical protein